MALVRPSGVSLYVPPKKPCGSTVSNMPMSTSLGQIPLGGAGSVYVPPLLRAYCRTFRYATSVNMSGSLA